MKYNIDGLSRSEIEEIALQYIHHERNRKIFIRRYCDGILFEPLAEEFDLSVRQVQNIIYDAEKKFFPHVKI